jgi:histidinol-phosphatase (PHP family)
MIDYQEAVKKGLMDVFEVYERYFTGMKKAAQSKIFSSLAHPDFVWRYFPWPSHKQEETITLMKEFLLALTTVKNTGVEANARAIVWMLDKPGVQENPMEMFFSLVSQYQAPVTIGSDAHRPLQIAECFGELTALLKRVGIKKVALFDQKKMRLEKMA